MFVLAGDKGAQRVVIGRHCIDLTGKTLQHPLLVDPDTLKVEVMKDTAMFNRMWPADVREGKARFGQYNFDRKSVDLMEIALPGNQCKSIMTGLPQGQCVLLSDEIHVLGMNNEWWYGSLAKKQIRKVATLPSGKYFRVAHSSHYGVLVYTFQEYPPTIYQVVVTPKKSAK